MLLELCGVGTTRPGVLALVRDVTHPGVIVRSLDRDVTHPGVIVRSLDRDVACTGVML